MVEGILLVNLGTPDSFRPPDVARYLREFLMDPFVIDVPAPLRWLLVNAIIAPRRARVSAGAYARIWNAERGSPLKFHSQDLAAKVQAEADASVPERADPRAPGRYVVRVGMRYGRPSLAHAAREIADAGATRVTVVPLYPQYARATTETALEESRRALAPLVRAGRGRVEQRSAELEAVCVRSFFDAEPYLDALAEASRAPIEGARADHVLLSFHGLPERQVLRAGKTCRFGDHACCATLGSGNRDCYRAQCVRTAGELARRLGLAPDRYTVAFQSRLGGARWIGPPTDATVAALARRGVKRLVALCPSFVTDCVETLEEIAIRARESFLAAGGEELVYVPCLNSSDRWVKALFHLAAFGPRIPLFMTKP